MHKSLSSNDVNTPLLTSFMKKTTSTYVTPNSATYLVLQSLMLLSNVYNLGLVDCSRYKHLQ